MADPKEKNKELYAELRSLDDQIKKMNTHLERMDEQISEVNSSRLVVSKFSELKLGDELWIPLTSGIYMKAELKDKDRLLINAGSSVTLEKKPSDVLDILDSQLAELSSYRDELIANMKKLIAKIEELQKQAE